VDLVAGHLRTRVRCEGASLEGGWLEGIPARPRSDASGPEGALHLLQEPLAGQPGALAITLVSSEVPELRKDLDTAPWERVTEPGANPLVYRARALAKEKGGKGIVVEKRYFPPADPDAWHLDLEIEIRNEDPELAGRRLELRVRGAALVHAPDPDDRDFLWGFTKTRNNASPQKVDGPKVDGKKRDNEPVVHEGEVEWGATSSTYFAVVLDPSDPEGGTVPMLRWDALTPATGHHGTKPIPQPSPLLCVPTGVRKAGVPAVHRFRLFAGPTADEVQFPDGYRQVLARPEYAAYQPVRDPGWFTPIETLLFWVMKAFHLLVKDWGVAIILLTVVVRGLMFPLSRKQLKSTIEHSRKMQKIKPMLDSLKEKHGKDRQKMAEAQMRLMKEHDVPLMPGGCLVSLLQLPIWIALYGMLQRNYDLRHAEFLWIDDLSRADHLWHMLPSVRTIPLVPNMLEWLNLLPIVMGATWFWSSKLTMTAPADEQQAQMQKMMQWMPLLMVLFMYTMPAGLCLYIAASSAWGIVESRVIRKRLGVK
jgi:YidC/Oxa1 family membrane protein insertase